LNRLQDKTAVVVGGASGIGLATAELFAREGAQVVIASRKAEKGDLATRQIKERTGRNVTFLSCDVTKENEVKELVRKGLDLYKKIDVWVNSAGILTRKNFEELTEEEWDDIMNTNLKGVFFCCKHVLPSMMKVGKGSVVNISSFLSLIGKSDTSLYTASKGGVTALSRSLALRYARYNVRINCICPGWTVTDMNRDTIEKAPDPARKLKELEATYPLGRLGQPGDVAYAALYLASDESQWITGIALPVDGGYTAGKE
jgi:NAD(P)-dependent dehydrogenase (short-subunit alcohol dehydrogenase family)